MSLRVVQQELLKSLDAQTALFVAQNYRIGLFQNDVVVTDIVAIGDLVIANFGGYGGLLTLPTWGAATWISPRASSTHIARVWTADGTTTNSIYGYYVVDGDGDLAWFEKRVGGPQVVGSFAGQTYTVNPVYTRRSEF